MHFIECGLIDGVSWIHGLGYQPHIALYQDPVAPAAKDGTHGRAVFAVGCSVSVVGQRRAAVRRALRAEVDPLGQAGRLPADRHDRRPAQAGGIARRRGHGTDEAQLRPDCRGGRGLRDHGQHRGPRLFHHQPRPPGADACLLPFALSAAEPRHGQFVHRRPGSGGLLPPLPRLRQPRARQGRQPFVGRGCPRLPDGHRREPLRDRRRRERRQHPPDPRDPSRSRLSMACSAWNAKAPAAR